MRNELIDPASRNDLVDILAAAGKLGVDTEFMRERTYYAQLCLVQIATPGAIYCVDPLSDGGLESFWEALCGCPWVVHAGRQDLEVVLQTAGRLPPAVFDTQVAAGLLGMPPQLGYGQLVSELFGVALAKGHTRADWSQRPLGAEVLDYAADDVAYLLDAESMLVDRLVALGRLEWAQEDSAGLLDRKLYEFDTSDAVERLKGARALKGRARRTAVRLAAWREARARQSNRPRQWILKDSVLLEIAASSPSNDSQLAAINGMPPATARRSGRELLAEIRAARDDADDYVPPRRPDERQLATLKRLQSEVARVAETLGIAAEIVAPRKELAAAAAGDTGGRVFSGWRLGLVGQSLLELL